MPGCLSLSRSPRWESPAAPQASIAKYEADSPTQSRVAVGAAYMTGAPFSRQRNPKQRPQDATAGQWPREHRPCSHGPGPSVCVPQSPQGLRAGPAWTCHHPLQPPPLRPPALLQGGGGSTCPQHSPRCPSRFLQAPAPPPHCAASQAGKPELAGPLSGSQSQQWKEMFIFFSKLPQLLCSG